MLRRTALTILVGLASTTEASHPSSHAPSPTNMIIELDKRLNGFILANDALSAAGLYDDDFILTVAGGGFKRKADMLADIGNRSVKLSLCETSDMNVRIRGSAAVLTGTLRQAGTIGGRVLDVRLHVTDTWVKVNDQWLLLAGHASPVK
jgi:hypothetical protein